MYIIYSQLQQNTGKLMTLFDVLKNVNYSCMYGMYLTGVLLTWDTGDGINSNFLEKGYEIFFE